VRPTEPAATSADERCLGDDTIVALMERALDAPAMARVDQHLDRCARCRAMVATLAEDVAPGDDLEATANDDEDSTLSMRSREVAPEISARLGTTLKGKWHLERLLGVGGTAAVYLGRHRIGRADAIKIVHAELARDAEVRARFLREARAVNRLAHPGAVAIRDIDTTDDGAPFLVMEYLEGTPLGARRGMPAHELLAVVDEVLDVLVDAHALGIIHRDIKPANIFLLRDGGVRVLDFGLARLCDLSAQSVHTQAGQTLGTLAYMPPEQLRGEAVDHRADVFALGATIFRMLTGRAVHGGRTMAEILTRIAFEPAPPLASVAPELAPDLCRVVDRALAFRVEDRYPDAEAMQRDVRALLRGRGELSCGDEPTEADDDATAAALCGTTVGGYRLERLIARGGMGAVYEARRDRPAAAREPAVALKLILADELVGDAAAARFRREIHAAARIDSPHVVKVLDAGVDDTTKRPFYVMELIAGRDLGQWIAELGAIAPDTVVRIALQACRGMRAAAALGIVHRDVKPANILLAQAGEQVIVKLCDFGLAKLPAAERGADARSLTHSGGMLGTPRYASPEQATRANAVDERADIWGLCMSMHEALSGRRPWAECETLGQLIVAICTRDVEPLAQVAPWVDAELARLVHRGLQRDLRQRWADVAALEDALAALVESAALHPAMMVARTAVRGRLRVKRRAPRALALAALPLLGLGAWVLWPTGASMAGASIMGASTVSTAVVTRASAQPRPEGAPASVEPPPPFASAVRVEAPVASATPARDRGAVGSASRASPPPGGKPPGASGERELDFRPTW
jgi:serine/threonine protein kinase